MNTLSREHTTDPITANVQNLLVMSASGAFRHEVIRTAITQTLEKNERVLFVTPQSAIQNVFRQYRGDLPPNTARYLDTLGSEHAPLNRPFAAFAQQQVLFTIPAYLHRQLVIPTRLISESVAHEIGLVVIDSLDGHDPQRQAILELFLLRFCLHPVDGILRRAVVTVQPITEPSPLADWLRADLITDPLPTVEARPFVSAWTGTQQREIVLTLAAGDGLLTPETLDVLAQHSLAPGAASLVRSCPRYARTG